MARKGRILLIGAEEEENLALRYLGGVLVSQGHEVRIAPCSDYGQIDSAVKEARNYRPDLIGISISFQSLANMFFELIEKIKTANVHITVGGHFPTFEYRKILETQKGIDSVIRFEGESAIVALIDAIIKNKDLSDVPNLAYVNKGKIVENPPILHFQDLDALPFPLRSKTPLTRLGENFATLVASRGCFHSSCLYCCIGAFHSKKQGQRFALRSPKSIADEIAMLYHKQNVRIFQFHDDNFMLRSHEDTIRRFRELKTSLEKQNVDLSNIAFLIKARPDSITEEVAEILAQLGIVGIFLGIENASESGLKSLIRGLGVEDIHNSMNVLRKFDMSVTFNLLIFHPNATLDEINQNIYFMKNNSSHPFDFGRAEIVAGSPLERQVINEGLLEGKWPNWSYRIKDPNVERLFYINLETFRKKGSNYTRTVHGLIALAYRAFAVNRLYTGSTARRFLRETNEIIMKSNAFTLKRLLEAYKISAKPNVEEINELFNSMQKGYSVLLKESSGMEMKINRLQILEKKFNGLPAKVQNSKIIQTMFKLD